ncbi:MAG: hypothetical protein F6K22_12945 [Okeania sp. SIO2F4]|uniref:hypothetical protein n=1 Tax=Okeania sp. SIO2F4 TaxID=2607790 RepID=UPI00142BD335|nr:hypothetical protein [Okeania sp. SIO2F4]NES03671.1 hypothetical protein [Okeania sp. SIO2F4]
MTGFIRGLFGKKDDNQPKEAFFLDQDAATSLGNLDYMRKSKTVKRSYPKAAGKLNLIEGETQKAVSSMQMKETVGETKTPSYSSTSSFSTSSFSTSTSTQSSTFQPTPVKPRTISNSNDGIDFKSMARDMKKKR